MNPLNMYAIQPRSNLNPLTMHSAPKRVPVRQREGMYYNVKISNFDFDPKIQKSMKQQAMPEMDSRKKRRRRKTQKSPKKSKKT